MSRINKLLLRFLTFPVDFTFRELCKLLKYFGFYLYNKGMTSGSRVLFVNSEGKSVKVHRPHGREPMDVGALKDVRAQLAELEVL
jgi:predicted RNA binding protein YcfA (HicA-like mRNA interferase family)